MVRSVVSKGFVIFLDLSRQVKTMLKSLPNNTIQISTYSFVLKVWQVKDYFKFSKDVYWILLINIFRTSGQNVPYTRVNVIES